MSSISSDLYEQILKPNTSHTNRIIQVAPCKTTLTLTNNSKKSKATGKRKDKIPKRTDLEIRLKKKMRHLYEKPEIEK